ncbi:hypothetical protein [Uliginosibacterium sp. 31-12]|uniref:hypothetical protein n=1 Tax=Uliginosibacterium sp. 31-12 TaxID=3062781 RepID=UPI0026E12ABD|nr:hypothetical protein [Uliginosibacterium sp. 31-12]MDO6386731.1 hypothetical protein [Uliginosibacterium sp. 31-12]
MLSSKFQKVLSKTSSVLSMVFIIGVTSGLIAGAAGSMGATFLGFFGTPAIFWEFGFWTTTLLCGVPIVCGSSYLILRGVRNRFGLKRLDWRSELVICCLNLLLVFALAWVPRFSASSQAYFFFELGFKALMLSLAITAIVLIWRGELEVSFANATMEARETGVSAEYAETLGVDAAKEKSDGMLGQLFRAAILIPVCVWMLAFVFSFQFKQEFPEQGASSSLFGSPCEDQDSYCVLRRATLYLEDARDFSQAKKRIDEVLKVLPPLAVTCPDSARPLSVVTQVLSGAPLPEKILPEDTYRLADILSGEKFHTDIYVFYTRYKLAVTYFNDAMAAHGVCSTRGSRA